VSAYITRWEFPVGVITILVCFFFSKGVWGFLGEIFSKKKKDVSMGSPS